MKNTNKNQLINELANLYHEIDYNDNIEFMIPPSKDCWPQTIKELREEIQLCKDILSGKITKHNKEVKKEHEFDYRKILGFCK